MRIIISETQLNLISEQLDTSQFKQAVELTASQWYWDHVRKEESLDMFPGAHFQLIVETWRDTNVEFEIRIRVLSLRGAGTNIHLQSASLLILQLLNKLPQIKSCKLQ